MFRSLVLVLLVVVALAALLVFYPSARLFAIVAVGRSPACPMANALRCNENARLLTQAKDRILSGSRLVEKDSAGYHLWQTPYGPFWITDGSDYVLPFNLAERERKIYGSGEQAVHAGDIVLDCGAHIGTDTRQWVADGAKVVVAIEPAPENLECLRRNLKDEIASGRVILYPKGVWDKEDTLTIQVDPQNSAADSFVIHREGAVASVQVPLTTIDKLVAELKLPRVDYIKMDIEGAEQRALAGAQATIARFHPRMSLTTYHRPDDPAKIPELVRKAWPGYRMECGPCAQANGRIRPDVLYFR